MQGFLILSCIIGGQTLASVSTHLDDSLGIVIIGVVSLAVSVRSMSPSVVALRRLVHLAGHLLRIQGDTPLRECSMDTERDRVHHHDWRRWQASRERTARVARYDIFCHHVRYHHGVERGGLVHHDPGLWCIPQRPSLHVSATQVGVPFTLFIPSMTGNVSSCTPT